MKKFLTCSMMTVLLVGLAACTQSRTDTMTFSAPDHRPHLVIFFKLGTTDEQIKVFRKDITNTEAYNLTHPYSVFNGHYLGVAVDFTEKATAQQRDDLKRK